MFKAPTCPRCDAELEIHTAEDSLVVSMCKKGGHGIFLTHKMLREVKSAGQAVTRMLDPVAAAPAAALANDDGSPNATIRCPRCSETMNRRTVAREDGDVTIDVCDEHGTWFDSGELQAVFAQRKTAPPDPTAEKQAKATLDVALALENARDETAFKRGVDLVEDVMDIAFGRPYRRRRGWYD